MTFRLLFVGDVVGSAGCSAVLDLVPKLREELRLDAVVANAENSTPGGRGITKESGTALLSVADFLTLGNHAFDAEGHEGFLEHEKRAVRPANLDGHLPGRGWGVVEVEGVSVGVTNVLGPGLRRPDVGLALRGRRPSRLGARDPRRGPRAGGRPCGSHERETGAGV